MKILCWLLHLSLFFQLCNCGSDSASPLKGTDGAIATDGGEVLATSPDGPTPADAPLGGTDGSILTDVGGERPELATLPDGATGAVDSCGEVCKDGDVASACGTPRGPVDAPAGGCNVGEIWVQSRIGSFNSFCGRLCASSLDCPNGSVCVTDNMAADYAGAVCVSDQLPLPVCDGVHILMEGPRFACLDAETLGTMYVDNRTGIAGYEVSKCPNGCQNTGPDGGIWGKNPGNCR